MNDKQYTKLAFIALGLLLLWWLWQRRQAALAASTTTQAPTTTASDPEQAVFENGGPPIQSVQDVGTININNQGLGYLSNQYFPLFGFVGMAQGIAYQ